MENSKDTHGVLETPLTKRSLVDRIIDRITEALVCNELAPGDRLPSENELVSSLGVGKSSVREAIKILQAMGVVEVHRGDGTFIASQAPSMGINPMLYQLLLDQGSIQDIFALREMFEPGYTILAMHNAASSDIENIKQSMLHFEELVKHNQHTGEDDLCFHLAILEATHNPYVIRIGTVILKLFMTSVSRSVLVVPQQAVNDHRKIFDAFIKEDATLLYQVVLESFCGWEDNQTTVKEG